MISGVAGPAAVDGGIGNSEGVCRDAEMADDEWDSGDFDAAKILADDDRCWNGGDGDDHHAFDAGEVNFFPAMHDFYQINFIDCKFLVIDIFIMHNAEKLSASLHFIFSLASNTTVGSN